MEEKLSDIGEKELINRLKQFTPENQINDDTALINCKTEQILINNDVLVENIHFSNTTASFQDIGWKSVTSNLSDLAASGVEEIIGVTIGLVAPKNTQWQAIKSIYEGIDEALKCFGGHILGGDCSEGSEIVISITAIGTLGKLHLRQSRALPGDWIIASGPHGLSRLGLALLNKDPLIASSQLPESLKRKAINSHKRPIPPLKALNELKACKPKGIPWRAAGTDSSDGLLEAIKNLCTNSSCQAIINPSSLPKTHEWPKGGGWDHWCLCGGEDFELIISLPPIWGKQLIEQNPNYYLIGYMEKGNGQVFGKNGENYNLKNYESFNHY